MYPVRPNRLMRKMYLSALWRIPENKNCNSGKHLYLTFDDGPVPEVTPWALSMLKEYKAKATFFCVGANIEKYPLIFRKIISEGHAVGNHTYTHLNGWKTKTKEYLENTERCKKIMDDVQWRAGNSNSFAIPLQSLAMQPSLFRPPYGKMKRSQYTSLKSQYSVVMWDVLSGDFDLTISQEKCLKNVLTKSRKGSIIVFHDSLKAKKNLLYTLPKFLDYFSRQGFEFLSLVPALSGGEVV